MIIKIQKPLFGNMEFALAYNEDRSFACKLKMTPELTELMSGTGVMYFKAHVTTPQVEIEQHVEDQPW